VETNQKWLIAFFKSITTAQWFFIGMGAITLLFIRLMMSYHDQSTQSNFKKDDGSRRNRGNNLTIRKNRGEGEIEKKS